MILLAADCLLFQLANGESIPFTAETVSIELVGGIAGALDPEMVQNATAAVFHYFKRDLQRETVMVAEFATALQKVLQNFGFSVHSVDAPKATPAVPGDDLSQLASQNAVELLFFSQLRHALRRQLDLSPRLIRFHGLRGCVKRLAGAQRWSPRCNQLRDQIIDYLRSCVSVETEPVECVLVVK